MRTRVRMWWVVKWGGLWTALGLWALCIASSRHWITFDTGGVVTFSLFHAGYFRIELWDSIELREFGLSIGPTGWEGVTLWWGRPQGAPWTAEFGFSLVPLAIGLSVASACCWLHDARARRQARLNQCARCGYDRAGLADGAACPECGGKA